MRLGCELLVLFLIGLKTAVNNCNSVITLNNIFLWKLLLDYYCEVSLHLLVLIIIIKKNSI